jgi:hypothetical protein
MYLCKDTSGSYTVGWVDVVTRGESQVGVQYVVFHEKLRKIEKKAFLYQPIFTGDVMTRWLMHLNMGYMISKDAEFDEDFKKYRLTLVTKCTKKNHSKNTNLSYTQEGPPCVSE